MCVGWDGLIKSIGNLLPVHFRPYFTILNFSRCYINIHQGRNLCCKSHPKDLCMPRVEFKSLRVNDVINICKETQTSSGSCILLWHEVLLKSSSGGREEKSPGPALALGRQGKGKPGGRLLQTVLLPPFGPYFL